MRILLAIAINTAALLVTAYFVPGFNVASWQTAVLAAIIFGLINTFVRPLLVLLTLPLTVLTLGFFLFVVNALILFMTTYFVSGFTIDGWLPAIIGAIVLSLVSAILSSLLGQVESRTPTAE